MAQANQNYSDMLKTLIFEDYLRSIATVRAGENPDIAFRKHEARVRKLRSMVAASEARPGSARAEDARSDFDQPLRRVS